MGWDCCYECLCERTCLPCAFGELTCAQQYDRQPRDMRDREPLRTPIKKKEIMVLRLKQCNVFPSDFPPNPILMSM